MMFSSAKDPTVLKEYSSKIVEVPFTEEERSIIESEFKDKIEVHPNFKGEHEISTRQFVGYIVLPNHNICIQPKIPTISFINMVRYALDLPELSGRYLQIVKEERNYYDILVKFLIQELEQILQEGIIYGYRNHEDNITCVRGKVLFKEHIMINKFRPDRICCSFSDFSPDILENQIIRYTLFYLSHCYFLDESLYGQLINYYNRLDQVDLISIQPEVFRSIEYTPLNDRYHPILNLCEMFLLDTSLDLGAIGDRTTISFLININRLFEIFIGKLLTKRLDKHLVELQRSERIESQGGRNVRADILISYRGTTTLVLDTKYMQTDDDAEHGHVAQMNMYSDAYKVSDCGLIYAGNAQDYISTDLRWGVKLHILTFDLTASDIDKFEDKCSKFINTLTINILDKKSSLSNGL